MRIVSLMVGLALLGSVALAQEAAPALSEVDQLRVRNALQAVEIAELRRQQAIAEAQRVIQSLQKDGYTLDLESMTYRPMPADDPPEEATASE